MVHAACGFFDLFKVDMFLNPTDIEPERAAADNSIVYTPEGEVSAEFHGIPHTNPSFILLDVGYPMNCYWKKLRNLFCFDYVFTSLHIYFTNVLSVRMDVRTYYRLFQRYSSCI